MPLTTPFDTVIFDLDGTISDSAPGILASLDHAFTATGLTPPPDLVRFIGPPFQTAFASEGFTPDEVEVLIRTYRAHYWDTGAFINFVYPGIEQLLTQLAEEGYRLAIATSKPEPTARRILEHWGYTHRFEVIGGATFDMVRATKAEVLGYVLDQLPECKPVMIGDRYHDVQGSAAFDIPCIGVNWGYGGEDELSQAGARWIIDQPEQIFDIVHRRLRSPTALAAAQARRIDQPEEPEGFRQYRYTPPPTATTILLVRHGESQAAQEGKPFPLIAGQGDPHLHPNGHEQAWRLAERLKGEQFDGIYVTTLTRTHQTAAPLAAKLGMTPIEIADLREVYLGDWEGGLFRVMAAKQDPLFIRWQKERRWDIIPNAERMEDFDERLQRGLRAIVANHPGGRVVAVVHGGVIGQIMNHASGGHGAFDSADNASISELIIDGDHQMVRRFNDTAHLYG